MSLRSCSALVPPLDAGAVVDAAALAFDQQRAAKLGREASIVAGDAQSGPQIVELVRSGGYDMLVVPTAAVEGGPARGDDWLGYVRKHASCNLLLLSPPGIPREVVTV
jgi:hypothetical protein